MQRASCSEQYKMPARRLESNVKRNISYALRRDGRSFPDITVHCCRASSFVLGEREIGIEAFYPYLHGITIASVVAD